MFITHLVPGGVTGDVARAWRHARHQRSRRELAGRAARAVVIERASGQIVMVLVGLGSGLVIVASQRQLSVLLLLVGVLVIVIGGFVLRWVEREAATSRTVWGSLLNDSRLALFSRPAFALQMISSLVVVSTFMANFLIAAKAIGVQTEVGVLLPLVAPVLIAMLVPLTVAGWGTREAGAAAVWSYVSLSSAEGIAVSVTYGLIVFLSTLPGGVILGLNIWWQRR